MRLRRLLTRHFLLPFHERAIGRSTVRYFQELESSQWSSPAEIQELQQLKLRALLRHAIENIPFYRCRFRDAGLQTDADDAMVQLARLPPLRKDEIREAGDGLLWKAAPGGLTQRSTGGSTGEPLTFFLDRRREGYDQAARMRSHRWFGAELGDCEVLLWGSPIERTRTDTIRTIRDRLFHQHLLDAFAMSPTRMDCYLNTWDRQRPVALFGYPSSIALFVRHAQRRNRRLDNSRLKAVFVTGEVCYPHDRSILEKYFGVPVADCYGSREAGFIAHQCPEGGMHITAENVIVEIIHDGQPAPLGASGDIAVTHLDAYGMPFIRYQTGDVGRLVAGRCACGRGLPLMDVVQGRTTDFLVLPDGTIKHALSVIYPLREMSEISRFRVTQAENLAVTVEVVAERSAPQSTVELVRRRVRPVVGQEIPLDIRFVDAIEETSSGKFRYVVSHAHSDHEAPTN